MPLRIGFDMDGVLADFSSAFREHEVRLFGRRQRPRPTAADAAATAAIPRRKKSVRRAPGRTRRRSRGARLAGAKTPSGTRSKALRTSGRRCGRSTRERCGRIHELMLRHRWEVFFITQRPFTEGETVQRQTQRWLVAQGFDLPSVLVLRGSRGAAAAALRLDYHVDDRPQNCIDVTADSKAKTILIVSESNHTRHRQRPQARHRRRPPHQRRPGHPRPGHARRDQSQPVHGESQRWWAGNKTVGSRQSSVAVVSPSLSRQSSVGPGKKKAGGNVRLRPPISIHYSSCSLLHHSALSIQHCFLPGHPARRSG